MAKYKVESFSSNTKDNGNGYLNIYVHCKLINSSGNPTFREYRVSPDDRHRELDVLDSLLASGFGYAVSTGAKVEISEYKERMYLLLTLPSESGSQHFQVTGERIK
ncbi:TPA: hypothetical protein ACHIYU_002615 [Pseudomonas aeruginosa]|uniref:Uncharacterized protein n=1 Tax=Ectopseudomonas oleovorans TaxID=301 RepID=A0A653BBK6_ECTOL|nr:MULTISPECIES: hypothetical protein [Pseudomonas]MBT9570192.1 hypothetical protein [Pseudomonas umsongensis]CAE6924244.1 conserved protein of unknown function [Pseudomonas oleovorans]EKX2956986.1 hypothetical protein [Pseudomonas aeruginosa]MBG4113900.1 hypothetical protein [Pseudomonas aeruginosa]MBI6936970.1 hypothetical protein [Pseudomonas aeruginosa]